MQLAYSKTYDIDVKVFYSRRRFCPHYKTKTAETKITKHRDRKGEGRDEERERERERELPL